MLKNKITKKYFNQNNQRGFTLLFAVIISTLVLAVGASIISIALKQVILSGVGRDSSLAFYAANTGIECAFYWEVKGVGGSPAFPNSPVGSWTNPGAADCVGVNILSSGTDPDQGNFEVDAGSGGEDYTISTFRINNFKDSEDEDLEYCVDVSVAKRGIETIIESRGYNTCDENNPRRIERGLELRLNVAP